MKNPFVLFNWLVLSLIISISNSVAGDAGIKITIDVSPGLRYSLNGSGLIKDSKFDTWVANGRLAYQTKADSYGDINDRSWFRLRKSLNGGPKLVLYDDTIATSFPNYYKGKTVEGAYGNATYLVITAVSIKRDASGKLIPFLLSDAKIAVQSIDTRLTDGWNNTIDDVDLRVSLDTICATSLGADGVFGGFDDVLTTNSTTPIVGFRTYSNFALRFISDEVGSSVQTKIVSYLDWWKTNRGGFTFDVDFSLIDIVGNTSAYTQDFKVVEKVPVYLNRGVRYANQFTIRRTGVQCFIDVFRTNPYWLYDLETSTDMQAWSPVLNQSFYGNRNGFVKTYIFPITERQRYWRLRLWEIASHLRN